MKNKIIPIIGAGIGIVIIVIALASMGLQEEVPTSADVPKNQLLPLGNGLGITYTETNYQLKQILEENDISMSSPIKLDTPRGIYTYCNFFTGTEQQIVEFCTSTELLDSEGEFLGNIHAFGSPDEPKRIMAVIQVDPFLNQKQDAKTVFSVITDHVVCQCWNKKNEDGLSMDDWAEAYLTSHIGAGKPTTSSNVISLEGKSIQMKLITNSEGYEWQLLIA